jgi:hypothetical protein
MTSIRKCIFKNLPWFHGCRADLVITLKGEGLAIFHIHTKHLNQRLDLEQQTQLAVSICKFGTKSSE